MAFKSEEVKEQVRSLISEGKKPREILAIVGDGCNARDIGNLKFNMKNAAGGGKPKKDAPKKKNKKDPSGDEFQKALAEEINNVQREIDRLNTVAASYGDSNVGFALHLDKKIQAETKKLATLQELQE